jgi:nucleoid-associated protein YgaU
MSSLQPGEALRYTVQAGDSLSKIAKRCYGDPRQYPAIFEANRQLLRNPELVYPGDVLTIPPLASS